MGTSLRLIGGKISSRQLLNWTYREIVCILVAWAVGDILSRSSSASLTIWSWKRMETTQTFPTGLNQNIHFCLTFSILGWRSSQSGWTQLAIMLFTLSQMFSHRLLKWLISYQSYNTLYCFPWWQYEFSLSSISQSSPLSSCTTSLPSCNGASSRTTSN